MTLIKRGHIPKTYKINFAGKYNRLSTENIETQDFEVT